MKIKHVSLFLLIVLSYLSLYSQDKNIPSKNYPADLNRIETKFDSATHMLESKVEKIEKNQHEVAEEFSNSKTQMANRIINWSGFILCALAILIVIAGFYGMKEFSQIRRTERNMKEMLAEVQNKLTKSENTLKEAENKLKEINNSKNTIDDATKKYMEKSFLYYQGLNEYHSSNYLKARELLYKVLELENDNVKAMYLIGKSMVLEGDKKNPIRIFDKILAINPKDSYGYLGLAMCYSYKDRPRAFEYCNMAIELDPHNSDALIYLGIMYRRENDIANSHEKHLKAFNINESSNAAFFLGIIYYAQHDLKNSEKYFDKTKYLCMESLEKGQRSKWTYYQLGFIKGLNNNLNEAKSLFNAAYNYDKSKAIRDMLLDDLQWILKYDKGNTAITTMVSYLN